jgi:glycine/D-amino acid oxidase-like deaminating enzyme/nitrite reductase/ring-hydroxylating ferredoxin subunit
VTPPVDPNGSRIEQEPEPIDGRTLDLPCGADADRLVFFGFYPVVANTVSIDKPRVPIFDVLGKDVPATQPAADANPCWPTRPPRPVHAAAVAATPSPTANADRFSGPRTATEPVESVMSGPVAGIERSGLGYAGRVDVTLPDPGSYWLVDCPPPAPVEVDVLPEVDVVVVGGGIAGITTAYLLKQAGRTVALVEARRLLDGVTGYTTAKVSAQHGLIYAELRDRYDADTAAGYGASQLAAIDWLRGEIGRIGVDCRWADRDSFVYAEDPGQRDRLRGEADAAAECGLPASYVDQVDLPYPTAGAVRFTGQAQFHPVRWLRALADRIPGDGSHLVEQTRVLDVDHDAGTVTTDRGELRARDVVITTHFPILDRGFFFARMAPVRDLVVAGPVPHGQAPAGMYLAADTGHSIRATPLDHGRELVIVLGEHYRPGTESDVTDHHRALAGWAVSRLGLASIHYRWSAQDNATVDRLPYIGRYTPGSRHLWVSTGFGQWGMTNGTLAGLLLRDLITGADNPWAALFDPARTTWRQSAGAFVRDNATVAKHFIGDRLRAARADGPEDLAPGQAAVSTVGGHLAALHRDQSGQLTALSARCTHLGCAVAYNDAEQSWDCPCHGSRYALDGTVIHGPATEPLQPLPLPDASTNTSSSAAS